MAATGREQPGTAAYGIALLSRFPVQTWQVVRLPRIPMTFPMYLREPNKVLMVHEEPRAAMVARVDTPLGPMTVANTHLSFVPGWNRVQLRHLVRDLRGFPGPRVLMGDLNMTPPKTRNWVGMRSLCAASTFPADDRSVSSTTSSPTIRRCAPNAWCRCCRFRTIARWLSTCHAASARSLLCV